MTSEGHGARPTVPLESRRLLAMGGGGFSSSVVDAPLEQFIAALPDVEQPRICLLPTASGDPDDQIARFYRAFRGLGRLSHLSLFRLGSNPMPPRDHLLAQDVIYVGGGSLANLLAIWRVHGLDKTLPEAWERGVLLCGVSAGSMCWFEDGVTRSHGRSRPARGLGLLPGSNSVHYASDPERRACYRSAVLEGLPGGYGVDDGVALLFAGRTLMDVVSARPGACAYRVEEVAGRLLETPISPRLLEPVTGAREGGALEIAEFRDARKARMASARRSRPA